MRAVQLHRWIGYRLLENSIHLVTQFLQETTYYTDLSNSLFTVRSQEENDLGWGWGWGDGVVGRKIIVGNINNFILATCIHM